MLGLDWLQILVYVDQSFQNCKQTKKTIGGFISYLVEDESCFKITSNIGQVFKRDAKIETQAVKQSVIDWSSKRVRRVCTSTLQQETVNTVQTLDKTIQYKKYLTKILNRHVNLYIQGDCGSLIENLASISNKQLSSNRLEVDA